MTPIKIDPELFAGTKCLPSPYLARPVLVLVGWRVREFWMRCFCFHEKGCCLKRFPSSDSGIVVNHLIHRELSHKLGMYWEWYGITSVGVNLGRISAGFAGDVRWWTEFPFSSPLFWGGLFVLFWLMIKPGNCWIPTDTPSISWIVYKIRHSVPIAHSPFFLQVW